MTFFQKVKARDPHLFAYLPAEEVHPHDRFLEWLVLRFLPKQITPNKMTLSRLFLTPVVFGLILVGNYHIGIPLFLLTAFTDALDGSLARTRDQITRFGMLFDPLADKLLIGSLVFLLVFHIDYFLAIATLGIEIVIIVSALVAKVKFKTVTMANRWGKMKMILQVIAVFLTLIALVFENELLRTAAASTFGLAIGFAVMSLFRHGI